MADWGAPTFADPYLFVPEVARVLRQGGLFAFSGATPLNWLCFDEQADTYADAPRSSPTSECTAGRRRKGRSSS